LAALRDLTAAERQKRLRANDKAKGVAEVRGIRAPTVLHAIIKRYARLVIRENKPKGE
jgi:hypothetical protein